MYDRNLFDQIWKYFDNSPLELISDPKYIHKVFQLSPDFSCKCSECSQTDVFPLKNIAGVTVDCYPGENSQPLGWDNDVESRAATAGRSAGSVVSSGQSGHNGNITFVNVTKPE